MIRRVQTSTVQGSIPALLWKRAMPVSDFTALRAALEGQVHISGTLTFALLAMALLAMLYFAICESAVGQTVGKMLFGIRVAGVASPASFWRCLMRSLFLLPVFPFITFWLIDPLYMFFTQSSQRLLERWSRTVTIESNPFAFKISTV